MRASQNKILILVHRDEETRRQIVSRLKSSSYVIHEAETGNFGLEICEKLKSDIILFELRLLDVEDTRCRTALQEKCKQSAIVWLVESDDVELLLQTMRASDVTDYVALPLAHPRLLELAIHSALENARLRRLSQAVPSPHPAETEQQLRSIVESIPDIIFRLDATGKITYINHVVTRYGYQPEEMIGRNVFDYIHPEDCERARFHINERRTGGRRTLFFDVRLLGAARATLLVGGREKPTETTPVFSVEAEGLYTSVEPSADTFIGTQGLARDVTEKRLIEEQLRFQALLLDSVRESVIALDFDGRVTYWGRGAEILYGFLAAEMVGKHISHVVEAAEKSNQVTRLQLASLNGFWEGQYRQKRKDGTTFWSDATISVTYDATGKRFGLIALDRDISERKKDEESLLQLKKAVETMQLGVTITDVNGQIIYTNPAEARMHGYRVEELIGQNISIFSPDQRQKKDAASQKKEVHRSRESWNVRRDGSSFSVYLNSDVVLDASGAPLGTVTTCEDISARRRMEEGLRASEEWLRVALLAISDGVITTNTDGSIVSLNKAAESLTGWSQADAEGRALARVFCTLDEQTRQPIDENIPKFLKNDTVLLSAQTHHRILVTKSGLQRLITKSWSPIYDRNSEVIGVVIVLRDMTETRRLELAKANFLNAITHELRTPLTPIYGYAEMLAMPNLPAEKTHLFIEKIIENVKREEKLVNELLAMARMEIGQEHYLFSQINAYDYLQNMAINNEVLIKRTIYERYQDAAYEFSTEIEPALQSFSLKIDPIRIQQVIENLLTNAIKFSRPNRLAFSVKAMRLTADMPEVELLQIPKNDQTYVLIRVRDSGVGIPKVEHEKIFKQFYQLRASRTDVSDGMGYGLALVKRYVEAHGGFVTVHSEPGDGSQFSIVLPVYQ